MDFPEKVEGPWLMMAVLCEKVIEDKSGILSLIGIIDRITLTASGEGAPARMPPTGINLTAVIGFKSGFVPRGQYKIGIQPVSPSGKKLPMLSLPILLEGDDRGANCIIQFGANIAEAGLYWFDVFFEDRMVTRIPLRIVYEAISLGEPPQPPMAE